MVLKTIIRFLKKLNDYRLLTRTPKLGTYSKFFDYFYVSSNFNCNNIVFLQNSFINIRLTEYLKYTT